MYSILGTIVLNVQYIFSNRHFNCLFACSHAFYNSNSYFLIILQMLLYVYEYVRARELLIELLIIYDMMSAEGQRLIQSTITRRSDHMDKTNKVRH